MGDGHHGWAAAEILLAARDAFVFEQRSREREVFDLVFLQGIPQEWFGAGKSFGFRDAPVPGGRVDVKVSSGKRGSEVHVSFQPTEEIHAGTWTLRLPFIAESVRINGRTAKVLSEDHQGTRVHLPAGLGPLSIDVSPLRTRSIGRNPTKTLRSETDT